MAAYGTYAEGDTYFASRLYVTAWTDATNADKTIALAEATMRIDRLRFSGVKVADDQANQFPRYALDDDGTDPGEDGETTPDDVQYACFEVAMALLDERDPDIELENLTVLSHRFDKLATAKSGEVQQHTLAGIPSATAWRFLLPYLASRRTLKITRVS